MENLRLQGELRDLQRDVDFEEVAALRADVDAMRAQVLNTSDQLRHLQSTPVVSHLTWSLARNAPILHVEHTCPTFNAMLAKHILQICTAALVLVLQ